MAEKKKSLTIISPRQSQANPLMRYFAFLLLLLAFHWVGLKKGKASGRECPLASDEMGSMKFNGGIMRPMMRSVIPALSNDMHKGQAGRVAVLGGSFEYSGAPYYAAVSTLKTGGDLAWVFCHQDAAVPIKSYSPELIVLPVARTEPYDVAFGESIEDSKLLAEAKKVLSRIHSLVIGPGLGRSEPMLQAARSLIGYATTIGLPLVLDGDAIFLLSLDPDLVKGNPKALLTPNKAEFISLFKAVFDKAPPTLDYDYLEKIVREANSNTLGVIVPSNCNATLPVQNLAKSMGGVTVMVKGRFDIVSNGDTTMISSTLGSLRRCGGQGDILAGVSGLFMHWVQGKKEELGDRLPIIASVLASSITRTAARMAFKKRGRGTTTPDIVAELGEALDTYIASNEATPSL